MNDFNLSEEQINEFKNTFEIFDKDKDGFISMKDLGEIMKKALGQVISDSELQDVTNEMDKEGKQSIDFRDFLSFMGIKIRDTFTDSKEELAKAFHIYDIDKNGLISADELFDVFAAVGAAVTKDEVEELIKEYDLDGDGFLNGEEFERLMKSQ